MIFGFALVMLIAAILFVIVMGAIAMVIGIVIGTLLKGGSLGKIN